MNKEFGILFGQWLENPTDPEVRIAINDMLLDVGLEEIANKFSQNYYKLYYAKILYLTFFANIGELEECIKEISFSSNAEVSAFIKGFFTVDGGYKYYFHPNKEELIRIISAEHSLGENAG